jgi:hypothetical protein
MSLVRRVLVLSSALLILSGCEAEPDPGAPRAPLPSEIEHIPPSKAPLAPRSIPGLRPTKKADEPETKEIEAKPGDSKDSPPTTLEPVTPTPPPVTPPKDKSPVTAAPKS